MKKNLAFSLAVIMLLFLCSCGNANSVNVTVEIDCSDILNNYDLLDESLRDEEYVPSNGYILEKTEIAVDEGSDAIDVLTAIAKENRIQIDVSAGYAKGINNIYEKSCGEMSGWVYEVNNEWVLEEYTVSEGDVITWKYICDFSSFME